VKTLFLYPSVVNHPEIIKAIAIMNTIARRFGETAYFDTYLYEKSAATMEARAADGEFRSFAEEKEKELKPYSWLVSELQSAIDNFRPDNVVISCGSYEYYFLLTFWPRLRLPSETRVIIGGIHAILEPEEVMSSGLFDVVCLGEAEETFGNILEATEDLSRLSYMKNIFFMDRVSRKITKNPRSRLLSEYDLWPVEPSYALFGDEYFKYPFHGKIYRRFRFEVGRGCPFDCTYCANSALRTAYRGLGRYFRTRPLDSIKKGMKFLLDCYGIELFHIDDECLLAHGVEWLDNLFSWYGQEIKKPFLFSTRPETVTEEKINILKKAKAPIFVKMGVESGSERILRDICNRTTKIEQVIRAYEILHRHDIESGACFMLGFPFETREDIFKSIELARQIKPDEIMVNIFQPMPGQKLRRLCIDNGFMKKDDKPAFFTETSILRMPQISQKEIENLRRVFVLYATLPESYYPQIELCEKDYEHNRKLYEKLIGLRWSLVK